MSRTPIVIVSCLLLATLGCGTPPADPGANKQAANQKPAPSPSPAPAAAPAPKPVEPPPVAPPAAPPEADAGIDPAVDAPPEEPAPDADAPPEPAVDADTAWKPPPGADIRSDAVIAPGTPAANAEAFKGLPATKKDGPPVSAIGTNGIHFDSMVVGRGFEKSRCVEETDTFDVEVDDRASICLRIIHPAEAEETLTVTWAKTGGHGSRRSSITVKAMHAYLTRSYLPLKKSGYQGEWTATITTADDTVLATATFTVK